MPLTMTSFLCFSILDGEVKKSEIKTIEELVYLVENSAILPRPTCRSLDFIWNWRDYISPFLTALKNHSFYNAFKFSKEDGQVRMRVKRLPQDSVWEPSTGIKLLKQTLSYEPVGCADFRVAELELPKVVANLEKYFKRFPTHTRHLVSDSWLRLREKLERLPKMQMNFPPLKLSNIPDMSEREVTLPEEYEFIVTGDQDGPMIDGEMYEDGLFKSAIQIGLDVVVYTTNTIGLPWVGRVSKILDENCFEIHWFQRNGKSNRFRSMHNSDGSPFLSKLDVASVMMWNVSSDKSVDSFYIQPYRLSQIMREYGKYKK